MAESIHDILLRVRTSARLDAFHAVEDGLQNIATQASDATSRTSALRESLERIDRKKLKIDLRTKQFQEAIGAMRGVVDELDKLERARFVPRDIRKQVSDYKLAAEERVEILEEELRQTSKVLQERERLLKRQAENERNIAVYEAKKTADELVAQEQSALTRRLAARKQIAAALAEADRRANRQTGDLFRELKTGAGDFSRVGRVMRQTAQNANDLGSRLDGLSTVLTRISPIVRGLAILIGVTLAGALVSLMSSVTAAIGGLGLLITSFGAAMGPVIGLLIGLFSRLAKVMEVVQAKDKAMEAAADAAAESHEIQRQNAERLRNAMNTLRDAKEAVAAAARNLAESERQVAGEIENANEAVADAHAELARSNADLAQATEDAYDTIREAAERAEEAVLDLQDAQLGLARSRLGIKKAELELKQFLSTSGLARDEAADLFRKFEDVDFQPSDALRKALMEAAKERGVEGDRALELEELLLNVEAAKLREKQATFDLRDAEQGLGDAREENARLQREGIAGVESYARAVERQSDAAERLADAQEEANRLNELGVRRHPQVLAAEENLRDARQRRAEATRDLASVERDNAKALKGSQDALRDYERLLKDLSPAERGFALAIIASKDALVDLVRAGTDPLLRAFTGALLAAQKFGPAMANAMSRMGEAAATAFEDFLALFDNPLIQLAIAQIAAASVDLIRVLGGPVLRDATQAFLSLATGSLPLLRDALEGIADRMRKFRDAVAGIGPGSTGFDAMAESLKTVVGFAEGLVAAIASLSVVGSKSGNELFGWMAEGFKEFAEFARSDEGAEKIGKFFEETTPFAKAFLRFLKRIVVVGAKFFQFLAPALADITEGFNFILDIFDGVLDGLNELPTIIKRIIGLVGGVAALARVFKIMSATIAGFSIGSITIALGALGALIRELPGDIVDGFLAGMEWAFAAIPRAIKFLFEKAIEVVKRVFGIESPSTVFYDIARDVVRGFINGLRRFGRLVYAAASALVTRVIRGAMAGVRGVLRLGGWIVRKVLEGARSIFGRVFDAGRALVTRVVNGVRSVATRIWNIGKSIVEGIANGITEGAEAVYNAARSMAQGIIDIVTRVLEIHSPSRVMEGLGRNTAEGFAKGLSSGAGALKDYIKNEMGAAGMAKIAAIALGKDWLFGLDQLGERDGRDRTSDLFARTSYRKSAIQRLLGKDANEGPRFWAEGAGRPAITPSQLIPFVVKDVLGGAVRKMLPGLATGGLVTGRTFAELGEGAHKEVVLPLSDAVFKELARAITSEMAVGGHRGVKRPPSAMAGGYSIREQHIHLPAAPGHSQMGDPRHQAVQFAREMARRGGGSLGGPG